MAYSSQGQHNRDGMRPTQIPQGFGFPQYQPFRDNNTNTNGYRPPTQNGRSANGHHDPRYGPVHGSHQHRPPIPSKHLQQAPQKAYAVAISPPLAAANCSKGVPNGPDPSQPPLAALPQRSGNGMNGYSSKPTQQQARLEPPLDYQLLLLSLAEEYFAAAYGSGSMAEIVRRERDNQEYYKLIATGLGCLEAVLKHFKMLPEREAIVRLRYATVLYEETDNTMEAEEALSKGISLCDRHRLFDLKYNMQHLLARMLFQKNHRAAFKFLESITKDAEAYQHIAWVYAFRFLKVSLHLELSTHQDLLSAISQLKFITTLSNDYGDKTVLAVATASEALTYLRVSNNSENTENAQRALATVRSLQLEPKVGRLHQLAVFTSMVDLCCLLQNFDPMQALAKMQIMQTALKSIDESDAWTDRSFAIPIPSDRMPSCNARSGIIRKENDGSLVLLFDWVSKDDIYDLGYLLSGAALSSRNAGDGQRSEHMLEEGIKRLQCKSPLSYSTGITNATPDANRDLAKTPKSIQLAASQQLWREVITCYMRLHLGFTLCARTSWPAAKEEHLAIQAFIRSIPASIVPEALLLMSTYLEAVIYQGTGDLDNALKLYQSGTLSIHTYRKTLHPSHLYLDIVLLSSLNTLLIIRTPNHPQHSQLPSLLSLLEHLCLRNPNRQIQSAYHLLTATTSSSTTILLTKQALQSALQTAKQSDNKQLMCMVLNFMSRKFFRGVVGEQAEKSARASQTLAQKCMDALWMSVAAGTLGDTLEAAGRIEEAKRERRAGEVTAGGLPEALQAAMSREREDGDVVMLDDGPLVLGDGV